MTTIFGKYYLPTISFGEVVIVILLILIILFLINPNKNR